jgi:hypothetical protein
MRKKNYEVFHFNNMIVFNFLFREPTLYHVAGFKNISR